MSILKPFVRALAAVTLMISSATAQLNQGAPTALRWSGRAADGTAIEYGVNRHPSVTTTFQIWTPSANGERTQTREFTVGPRTQALLNGILSGTFVVRETNGTDNVPTLSLERDGAWQVFRNPELLAPSETDQLTTAFSAARLQLFLQHLGATIHSSTRTPAAPQSFPAPPPVPAATNATTASFENVTIRIFTDPSRCAPCRRMEAFLASQSWSTAVPVVIGDTTIQVPVTRILLDDAAHPENRDLYVQHHRSERIPEIQILRGSEIIFAEAGALITPDAWQTQLAQTFPGIRIPGAEPPEFLQSYYHVHEILWQSSGDHGLQFEAARAARNSAQENDREPSCLVVFVHRYGAQQFNPPRILQACSSDADTASATTQLVSSMESIFSGSTIPSPATEETDASNARVAIVAQGNPFSSSDWLRDHGFTPELHHCENGTCALTPLGRLQDWVLRQLALPEPPIAPAATAAVTID